MSITVLGIPGSPYVRSALLVLEETGAAYRFERQPFGVTATQEWGERQPFRKIPAFEHDGFRMYETAPFLRYVDKVQGSDLQPRDPRAAFRMDQLMNITDWYVMRNVTSTIGFQRLIAPLMGRTTDEAACAAALPDAQVCIAAVDDLLGEGDFLVGDHLSLADLMLVPHIDFLAMTPEGEELLDGSPLRGWLERMRLRPSMKATDPAVLMAPA